MPTETNEVTIPGETRHEFFVPETGQITGGTTTAQVAKYSLSRVTKPNKRPKPAGWRYPTAYSRREVIENYPRGRNGVILPSGVPRGRRYYGYLGPNFVRGPLLRHNTVLTGISSVNIDMVSQAESKALNRLLTHGSDRDGTWKPGIAWRERKETANLLTEAARSIFGAFAAMRSGNWRKAFDLLPNARRPPKGDPFYESAYWKWLNQKQAEKFAATPKQLASGYLALQNGWKPLLGDIQNAAEALAHRDTLADWTITGIGKFEKHSGDTIITRGAGETAYFTDYSNAIFTWQCKQRVKVRLDATISDQQLHMNAQLGLNNLAHLMWETTPLSYLLDYIIGIGAYLESLGAADGMKFMSGSVTRSVEYVGENRAAPGGFAGNWYGNSRYFEMDRRVYDSFPVPIFPLSLKPEPLKLDQLANALAVGYLALRGQDIPYSKMG